jgi:WD40 repeat protein
MAAMLGAPPEPVSCLASIPEGAHGVMFASGGDGSVKLWTADGEDVGTIMAPHGTAARCLVGLRGPSASTNVSLAVIFHQARPFDPNAFRLAPQNAEQQQRRAEAMAMQAAQAAQFERIARSVTVVELAAALPGSKSVSNQSVVLPVEHTQSNAQLMALSALVASERVDLASGDAMGCIHLWHDRLSEAVSLANRWQGTTSLQLVVDHALHAGSGAGGFVLLSVVGLKALEGQAGLLAAALRATAVDSNAAAISTLSDGHSQLQVPPSVHGAPVLVLDIHNRTLLATLDAHVDVVRCMCAMPDGALATGGGKRDGKVRVWTRSAWQNESTDDNGDVRGVRVVRESTQTLAEPGFVFDMAMLYDHKPDSNLMALACARYNTVKIVL